MQDKLIQAIEAAIIAQWPKIELLLIKAAQGLAVKLLVSAKSGQLPEKYKWLEELLDGCIDDLLPLFPQQ